MTKSLTVVADKFSLQAVKMITLAGGTAETYN
jgi:ribosomal protein L18E